MPFLQDDDSTSSEYVGGPIGSGLPAARLVVQPDKVLFVKRGFDDERDRVQQWIVDNSHRLNNVPRPGTDPCSEGAVEALGRNGQTALDAANGYVDQLSRVGDALGEIAQAYGLVEDSNIDKFRREPQ